ncbi:hypothetical protein [Marinifilum flexuosum]|uniref:hypothetical protein n=1 Tax=Marinifilum flexuosum TaxID=1117708 RepID=UPI0024904E75|nr:hypothetical protein [Marinifilum flexuosum]
MQKVKQLNKIPFGLKVKTLFSGKLITIGLFMLSVSMIILMAFLPDVDFQDSKYDAESVSEAKGLVLAVQETNSSLNGRRALKYEYEFYQEDRSVKGESYGYEESIGVGDTVAVEYLKDDSGISRIVGTKNGAFGIDSFSFLFVFVVLGLAVIGIPIYKKVKFFKMLKSGFKILPAKIQSEMRIPSFQIGKSKPIYRLKYSYEVSGSIYTKELYAILDEYSINRIRMSAMLVDSHNHTQAVVLENLPIRMRGYIVEKSAIGAN